MAGEAEVEGILGGIGVFQGPGAAGRPGGKEFSQRKRSIEHPGDPAGAWRGEGQWGSLCPAAAAAAGDAVGGSSSYLSQCRERS